MPYRPLPICFIWFCLAIDGRIVEFLYKMRYNEKAPKRCVKKFERKPLVFMLKMPDTLSVKISRRSIS